MTDPTAYDAETPTPSPAASAPAIPPDQRHPARYWHRLDDGRIQCDVCPRECRLREGQRGFCFVRGRADDELVLTTYGRSSGFCIDPIEKKPLNHFYPGSSVLSFGTAGCNLGCRFCQNWDISTSTRMDRLQDRAAPEDIAAAAREWGCRSVAVTYNDPVIFTEYAIDTALACRDVGVRSVAVTAGYVQPQARADLFAVMDAANVDLKGFTEDFYRKLTGGRLAPVLDTLRYLVHDSAVWTELTTLIIPGHNDSDDELHRMCAWIATTLTPQVPLHLTAFHPDHRMPDVPRTPTSTLVRAREIARAEGLEYVYTGNVRNRSGDLTSCPSCGFAVIERDGYTIRAYRLTPQGSCPRCGQVIPGRYDVAADNFGSRRIPITIDAGPGRGRSIP